MRHICDEGKNQADKRVRNGLVAHFGCLHSDVGDQQRSIGLKIFLRLLRFRLNTYGITPFGVCTPFAGLETMLPYFYWGR